MTRTLLSITEMKPRETNCVHEPLQKTEGFGAFSSLLNGKTRSTLRSLHETKLTLIQLIQAAELGIVSVYFFELFNLGPVQSRQTIHFTSDPTWYSFGSKSHRMERSIHAPHALDPSTHGSHAPFWCFRSYLGGISAVDTGVRLQNTPKGGMGLEY